MPGIDHTDCLPHATDLARSKRCFDKQAGRLIYLGRAATPDFWDRRWQDDDLVGHKVAREKDSYVTRTTERYLEPTDGIILEGGCGRAQHVTALAQRAYHCIGVDFARETVTALQEIAPELDIRLGDVRHLDSEDGYFAGYWSIGVIEHFWEGYESAGKEMARVIKPRGYLFLVFPYMSPLRKLKGRLGLYVKWDREQRDQEPADFYQFVLDHKLVIRDFSAYGFKLAEVRPLHGLKGVKDEISVAKPLLQMLYDYPGNSIIIRGLRWLLSNILAPVAGHSVLLVFERSASKPTINSSSLD